MYWGILLKIPTSNSTKFHYNRCMFDIDVSIIKDTVPEVHFRPYLAFHWRDVPGSSNLIFQTQAVEISSIIDVVYVNLRDVCT